MPGSVEVHEFDDFATLSERHGSDWQRIAAASPAATIFQTWEWTAAWWEHYGRGHRLWALAFTENGAVVGLAALMLPPRAAPLRTSTLLGTGGSDYLDILAAPDHEGSVVAAFLAHLRQSRRWDWLDLQQVRPGGVVTCLPGATAWRGETCPYLPLPGDWETFRRGLGKKLRQNIGYYERGLAKVYEVSWRTATQETLAADMDAFFDLHQQRWERRWMPGAFASRTARAFHADVARRLLDAGMLRLHTLSLDGEVRATLYCFQKGGTCYYYLGGFDPALAKLSIGTVLTAYAIRYAIEQDRATEFDFLRGDEGYKYRWGAVDRYNARVSLTRPGVRSTLLAAKGRASLQVEMRLKTWMHRRHGGAGAAKQRKEKDADA
jgi:CelD/BcsL family acetyltransferase involved in cellulose biosynthesis